MILIIILAAAGKQKTPDCIYFNLFIYFYYFLLSYLIQSTQYRLPRAPSTYLELRQMYFNRAKR